jgi:hypothetical protein
MTDKMVEEYIAEQEGELIQDDSQFVIDEDGELQASSVLSQKFVYKLGGGSQEYYPPFS